MHKKDCKITAGRVRAPSLHKLFWLLSIAEEQGGCMARISYRWPIRNRPACEMVHVQSDWQGRRKMGVSEVLNCVN